MLVRLLAALLVLGLCIGSAQAHDLGAQPAIAIVVDEVDESSELEVVVVEDESLQESRKDCTQAAHQRRPHYEPCRSVFRPPRTYAFN
ncbi:MAG TPA: hypothetical protein VIV11_01335 [Kofleriaceae bacterium]